MTIAEAREIILTETETNLTHEIATRIKDAEREVRDRSNKLAKKHSRSSHATNGW